MLLSGDLRGFPPSDLLQWVLNERVDGLLVVVASRQYRLRFHRGRLVGSVHDGRGGSLSQWLIQRGEMARAEVDALSRRADATQRPFLETLMLSGRLVDPRLVIGRYVSEAAMAFLRESRGRFYFDSAAYPFPRGDAVDVDVTHLVLEGMRRLDEESVVAELLPDEGSELRRLTDDPRRLSDYSRPLTPPIIEALATPCTLRELYDRIAADPHAVRMAVATMVRDGHLQAKPQRPQGTAAPNPAGAERLASAQLSCQRAPSAGERIFLTRTEAALLRRLEGQGRREVSELAAGLGLPSPEVVELVDRLRSAGLVDAQYRTLRPRWWAAATLAATLAAALLAGAWLGLGSRERTLGGADSSEFERTGTATALEQAIERGDLVSARELAEALGEAQNAQEEHAVAGFRSLEADAVVAKAALTAGYDALTSGELARARTALDEARAVLPVAAEEIAEFERRLEESLTAVERERLADQAEAAERRLQFDRELAAARSALAAGRAREASRRLAAAAALEPGNPEVERLLEQALTVGERPAAAAAPPPARSSASDREAASDVPAEVGVLAVGTVDPASSPPTGTTVEAGSPRPAAVEEPPGTLIVNAVPFGYVRIDGSDVGVTPQRLELAPGEYQVEVHREGYAAQRRRARVVSAERSVEAFVLEPTAVGAGDTDLDRQESR